MQRDQSVRSASRAKRFRQRCLWKLYPTAVGSMARRDLNRPICIKKDTIKYGVQYSRACAPEWKTKLLKIHFPKQLAVLTAAQIAGHGQELSADC